jgi:hypothetical protein
MFPRSLLNFKVAKQPLPRCSARRTKYLFSLVDYLSKRLKAKSETPSLSINYNKLPNLSSSIFFTSSWLSFFYTFCAISIAQSGVLSFVASFQT